MSAATTGVSPSDTPARPINAARTQARIELLVGFIVVAALLLGLAVALIGSGRKSAEGYRLHASFDHVDGLDVGNDVRVSGVAVGQVLSERVDPKGFRADVVFTVGDRVQLPVDSSAVITSDGLMGGKYIAITPGGDSENLKPGARVTLTQGSISLEQLLTKFVFSVANNSQKAPAKSEPASATPAGGAAPAGGVPVGQHP